MAPEPCKVLFVCTGNACRSQMAEGWLRVLGGPRVEVRSAGVEAHGLDPRAVAVMREAGVDLSGQRSTRLGPEMLAWADLVVTVCGHADARCPALPPGTRREHWPLEDPARAGGDEAAQLEAFRAVRDEIRRRVEGLLERLPSPVQVVHLDEVPLEPWSHGRRFAARMAQVGRLAGARKLGCRLVELPPGKAAWPMHAHHANEELFVILAGSGCLRLGGRRLPLRTGDLVAVPPGPGSEHQILNDGEEPLRYLVVSTMEEPDVVTYADSRKVAVLAGSPPGGNKARRTLELFLPLGAAVDYWAGED